VDISEAKVLSIELKEKNDTEYYQITVETPEGKYRFDVDALTGRIIDKKELKEDKADVKSEKVSKKENDIGSSEDKAKPEKVDVVNKEVSSQKNREMISAAKAKEIALNHAKLTDKEVTFVKSGIDKEDGRQVYDIEFYDKNLNEYDYEIDPYTGAVIDFDYDAEYYSKPNIKDEKQASNNNSDIISSGKAKKVALEHAKLDESEVKFVKRELTNDDGVRIYDVEFYTDDIEYSYEIDAETGKIIDYDYDHREESKNLKNKKNTENEKSDSKKAINETQAKKKALAQVPGAKMSDIVEFETDYDDGRIEYEGKIYYKNMEYEFEIDGYSGAIRDWDVESIDDD